MIRNYLKIGLRSLLKQKIYSVINIVGLATGIASCVLIVMFVANEFSYDNFHAKGDRIYKLALERIYPNHSTHYAVVPHSFGDAIQNDFAEVESVVKMAGPFNNTGVAYQTGTEQKFFEENGVMAADSNFFQVFSVRIVEGNEASALSKPTDVVLTVETARRYFGSEKAIGKTLRIFNQDYVVSAVCEPLPDNSHLEFDFLLRTGDQIFPPQPNFIGFNSHVYLVLKRGANPHSLQEKFPGMVDRYAAAQIETNLQKSWEDYKREGNGYRYFLQPLQSIHLDPTHIEARIKPGGNINYVYFLVSIAVLILIIACINFMNLSTARSAERGREVGVRKTMGSLKSQLVRQFLVESILVTFIATVVALVIVYTALPYFNELTGRRLNIGLEARMILSLAGITLIVGMMAGSYPAFVLSSFNPVLVMKGKFASNRKGSALRNTLVVFQFTVSIILIASTIVVSQQMRFMQDKSLGYDKDHVLVVERVFALDGANAQTFINELQRIPGVESAAGTFSLLGSGRVDFFGEQWTIQGSSEIHTSKSMAIDDDFADMIGFHFLEGRPFSRASNDSLAIILNETAVRTFELTDPVGKKLTQNVNTPEGLVPVEFTIVGVVRDFNFQSLHDPITPLTIRSVESFDGPAAAYAYARVQGNNLSSVIARAEELWNTLGPGQPFRYVFLDQTLQAQYENERRAGQLFRIFAGLAIIIACVGLFGLAAYTGNQRTKEIGIRKVLGASIGSVIVLLSRDFTRLIIISFMLATPLAWYLMNNWLSGFAYRIELGFTVFLFAGILALFIAWITVSYQSIKAALLNPVKSLKND